MTDTIIKATEKGHRKFIVTFESGRSEKLRLARSYDDGRRIFAYGYNCRSHGYWLIPDQDGKLIHPVYGKAISVRPCDANRNRKIRDTARKAACELEKSGLWPSLLPDLRRIAGMTDEDFARLDEAKRNFCSLSSSDEVHGKARNVILEITGNLGIDMFRGLESGLKNINYFAHARERTKQEFRSALRTKDNLWKRRWRKGYDNSLCVDTKCTDGPKAYYSEEYRDCGNGHYYIAVSESHALFCEDD